MKTEEDILTKSREVLETKGEWDLIDIKAAPYFLHLPGGSYQEVKFHVSKAYFECTNTCIIYITYTYNIRLLCLT